MKKTVLSATIITLNEEKDLANCLNSIKDLVDEIVVFDSGSTDRTVKIAESFGAKVYERKFDNYSSQKNFVAKKAKGDWILSLDADEEIPPKLAGEIKKAIKDAKYDAYLIPRRNFILGAEIKHTRWSPDKHVWLWRKGRGEWRGNVHEEVRVKGDIGELKNAKIHYQQKTVFAFFNMLNRYTEFESEEKVSKGIRFSIFRMFFDPILSFFRRFIYKRGFLDGWRGFVLSYLMAIYRMTTWIKVWEVKK